MIGGFGRKKEMDKIQNNVERQKMKERCEIFSIDITDVEQRLASFGEDGMLVSRFNDDADGYKFKSVRYYDEQGLHLNRFYYAMASLALKDVRNVFEIGTGDALSTVLLSQLFPEARIFTIDLPQGDPRFKRWRTKSAPETMRGKQRQERLRAENIITYEKNTFFLPSLDLPERFDFILVDGAHKYPQLAGDIMFAYNRIVEGGFLFFHDYYEKKASSCHVKQVVDWMAERIPERVFTFPMGTPPKKLEQKMALLVKGLNK